MAPKETGEALDAAVIWINKNIPKNESLLVLTDLQVLYPLTGRDSYRGVPFIFAAGELPGLGKQLEQVRNHILTYPPDWIITHRIPLASHKVRAIVSYLGLKEFILNSYVHAQIYNQYVILRRK